MPQPLTFPNLPASPNQALCGLTAAELEAGFQAGRLSPVDAAEAALARAEAIAALNAFTLIDRDGALAAARASAERWRQGEPLSPIDGVPATIKDIVAVAGWPLRYGSMTTDAAPLREDAPSVRRLRAAGAVLIGQTTTPEFGWKAVTDSRLFGITRNPHDPSKTPGGSSGGAAAAAAVGAGVLHLGTDGGGSIRIPSSFTGIAGLKPTFGQVPAHPLSAFGTVAHLGPMARCVDDLARMLAAMAGRDLADWSQPPIDLGHREPAPVEISGLRIGYWSRPPSGSLDPEIGAIVGRAVAALEAAGAAVEPFALPGEHHHEIFRTLWFAGAGYRISHLADIELAPVDRGLQRIAAIGRGFSAVDMASAQARRGAFGAAMDQALATYDFLVSPGAAILAFAAGEEIPPGSGYHDWTEWAGFAYPINLTQQPALVIPCGRSAAGLPVGLQIVGARGRDGRLLGFGGQVEALLAQGDAS
jgi:amidase/aspartyl-tRNA(Asn)/glutamyl-tRNA(Gln) amidotransferase subunit A